MTCDMKYCANCKHWYLLSENEIDKYGDSAEGECRRYPPNVPVVEGRDDSRNEDVTNISDLFFWLVKGTMLMTYPIAYAGEWCGEFELMNNPRWTEEFEDE